ncbi:hypothetical protein HPA02_27210 [Bisbaumannia pacifica]|uniref:Uncharacterized protein n=1 Tax=Bisbaumannia pacifica TaxID=77098 RepID=A0A510XAI7_9GAMM|nr:hypothetical protein [Halomonas pacifica]GEK48438.1 hypothetical protein HPA02_27210 [Halomonas pacifica]
MAEIDRHSDTWRTIQAWIEAERADAVESLIADHHAEQQRGRIRQLERLRDLAAPDDAPHVVADTYL